MHEAIRNQVASIRGLCKTHSVKELYLFGSATDMSIEHVNDLDFTVLFLSNLDPLQRGEAFLSLKYHLQELLGREIDLVSYQNIRNPVFKDSVDASKLKIYAA